MIEGMFKIFEAIKFDNLVFIFDTCQSLKIILSDIK